jgi:hypothetical protein
MKNVIFPPFLLRIGELNLHFWICLLTVGGDGGVSTDHSSSIMDMVLGILDQ